MMTACLRALQTVLLTPSMVLTVSAQCTGGWVRQGAGAETDFARSVAVDGSGNVYVTGSFSGAAVFSGVAIAATDFADDVYLAKYDPDGGLLWIRTGGGPNIDQPGKVAVDGEGNAYITGTHFRPAVFGGFALANAANQPNAFVVKYGPDGDVLWAITMGGDGWDSGDAIAYDANNDRLIVGGQFEGTAMFGEIELTALSQRDLYLVGIEPDGYLANTWMLAQAIGNEQVRGVTVAADGAIYAACAIDGTVTIGPTYTSAGAYDCMLLKLGPVQVLDWVRFGGGPADDL